MSWAARQRFGMPSAKLVLITLSQSADDHGNVVLSRSRLASETDQSIDTIDRRLAEFERLGLISKIPQRLPDGSSGPSLIRLSLDRETQPQTAKTRRFSPLARKVFSPRSTVPSCVESLSGVVDITAAMSSGVYLLCREGRVIYIGQSVLALARTISHHAERPYDQVLLVPCLVDDLDRTERKLIEALRPPLNSSGGPTVGREIIERTFVELFGQPDSALGGAFSS
jgi:hypothetical protein